MTSWHIHQVLSIIESEHGLDQAYARQVRWPQGHRVNLDSRLLLLGVRRLVSEGLMTEAHLRDAAWVLGCQMAAMDSYERFDDSLRQGHPAPLSFAYALPSMPLACVSVRHALRGLTYTITGGLDAGIQAFRESVALIGAGLARTVVTGAWESPSASAGPTQDACRLLLVVLRADSGDEPRAACAAAPSEAPRDGVVARLGRFLQCVDATGSPGNAGA